MGSWTKARARPMATRLPHRKPLAASLSVETRLGHISKPGSWKTVTRTSWGGGTRWLCPNTVYAGRAKCQIAQRPPSTPRSMPSQPDSAARAADKGRDEASALLSLPFRRKVCVLRARPRVRRGDEGRRQGRRRHSAVPRRGRAGRSVRRSGRGTRASGPCPASAVGAGQPRLQRACGLAWLT